jgi:hypothetical protein
MPVLTLTVFYVGFYCVLAAPSVAEAKESDGNPAAISELRNIASDLSILGDYFTNKKIEESSGTRVMTLAPCLATHVYCLIVFVLDQPRRTARAGVPTTSRGRSRRSAM